MSDRPVLSPPAFRPPSRRVVSLLVLLGCLLLLFWLMPKMPLLLFAGVLLAVALRGSGEWIGARTGLSGGWGTALFCLLIVALMVVGALAIAAPLAEQVDMLWQQVPQAFGRLRERIEAYQWGRQLLEQADPAKLPSLAGGSAASALSSTFGGLADLVVVLFIGLYGAADPGLYRRGIEWMVAPSLRPKTRQVCEEIAHTLRGWLRAQMISMAVVGVMTWAALWAVGVPLAPALALLAALMTFIPNIGPVLAAAPAILLALADGPQHALLVAGVYAGVQTVESYFITPYVQQSAMELPPALTIAVQIVGGAVFGTLGLALATPFGAMVLRLTQWLYVEDYLDHEPPEDRPVLLTAEGAALQRRTP